MLCLDIKYARQIDQQTKPSSLAIKMHGPALEQRQMMGEMKVYYTELDFYLNKSSNVPVTTPKAYAMFYDKREGRESCQQFNLIMVCSLYIATNDSID